MMRATDETPSESRGTTGSKRLGMKMADYDEKYGPIGIIRRAS